MWSALRPWVLAARLRTLPAAASPVLLAICLASCYGQIVWPAAIACLVFALLIQIATNYANDWIDFKKGADTAERMGPVRVVAAGMVTPRSMQVATAVTLLLALGVGMSLILWGGWWLLLVGLASMFFAVGYTGGPFPLAYLGLGELFVFLFFGLIAVCITFYIQTGWIGAEALICGVALGLLSSNILVVNNHRDEPTDRKASKRTLAVRFGRRFAEWEYIVCLLAAFALTLPLALLLKSTWVMLPIVLFPWAARQAALLPSCRSLRDYNQLLARTSHILSGYTLLLILGILL